MTTLVNIKFIEQGIPLFINDAFCQLHVLNEFGTADFVIVVSVSFLNYLVILIIGRKL